LNSGESLRQKVFLTSDIYFKVRLLHWKWR